MSKTSRREAILALEKKRQSKVIVYFLGDRQPIQIFGTKVANDVVPYFERILAQQGKTDKISLFLYGRGGDMDAPWPIVSIIREFCDEFEVIIPRRALSAATLLSLGANRIIMTPFATISPIDPEGNFPQSDGKVLQIPTEDIFSFIEFSKSKIGLRSENSKAEILKALLKYEPKELGNIFRAYNYIRQLAKGMLSLHLDAVKNKKRIDDIVENLTEKAYQHNHLVGRKEAKYKVGLGEIIEFAEDPDPADLVLIENLFAAIEGDTLVNVPLNVEEALQQSAGQPAVIDCIRALVQADQLNVEGKSTVVIAPNGQVKAGFYWTEV
jgi:hypothetical protein